MTWRWTIAGLALLAGCQSTKSTGGAAPKGDPLFGSISPTVQATPLATNPAANGNSNVGSLGQPVANNQPLAQPTMASPAVLATGGYPPLSGSQDLRIGTAPPASGNRVLPRNQTPAGVVAVVTADPDYGKPREAAPGVVPLDSTGSRVGGVAATGSIGGLEQALNSIGALNPKWHRLENAGEGMWRFTCSIPDRQESNRSRTYEGEGPTAFAAVQGVLDRVGRDK